MTPEERSSVQSRIQQRLLSDGSDLTHGFGAERRVRVLRAVARLLLDEDVSLVPDERASLIREIADAVVGLGPLEPLLRDPAVTEIMVNSPADVYVERSGVIERVPVSLPDAAAVLHLIDRVVGPLGLRVDASRPWVDARLPDGSRVHAIIPPLAVAAPALTIRKFARDPIGIERLVQLESLTVEMASFLGACVRARVNIIVAGGAGAGKTTLLNALASFIPAHERVITIEDAAELRLQQPHVVALESRPANVEGIGAVGIRELVRNALRMRPDRIVVGEVRGGEALDMLQAMNTGHQGSMSTAHANSPADLVTRLEAMVLMGDVALPLAAVRAQIAAGVNLIVHVEREGGARRVTEIAEVRAARGGSIGITPLVRWTGAHHDATGDIPRFLPALRDAGERLPSLFGARP
ncbi:MAG: CpaF family protein [Actinomycetota bacterium]|nr:CpaF family protein [Actinomycetota bacterium]